MGAKKAQGVVTPEVMQVFAGQRVLAVVVGFVEFGDRQKFHGGYPQLTEVGDLLDNTVEGSRVLDP